MEEVVLRFLLFSRINYFSVLRNYCGARSFSDGQQQQQHKWRVEVSPPEGNSQQTSWEWGKAIEGGNPTGLPSPLHPHHARRLDQNRPPIPPKYANKANKTKIKMKINAMCQTPSKRRTDKRQESNLVHFSLKMWNPEEIIFVNFLIINWPNFVYLFVDPRFYPPRISMKHRGSIPP